MTNEESSEIMEYVIREAVLEDLDEIVSLWRKLSIGQMEKEPYYKGSLEFKGGFEQLKKSVESSDCGIFIVKYDEKIQGFIEIWKDVLPYQIEKDDCAYILHCIYNNQSKEVGSPLRIVACLYEAAKQWALEQGKQYITADVFQHNKIVAELLQRDHFLPYKIRMVRKF